jgi:hypothetical protein
MNPKNDILGLLDGTPVTRTQLMERTIMCTEIFTETLDLLQISNESFQYQISDFDITGLPFDIALADRIYCIYLSELAKNGNLIDDQSDLH